MTKSKLNRQLNSEFNSKLNSELNSEPDKTDTYDENIRKSNLIQMTIYL